MRKAGTFVKRCILRSEELQIPKTDGVCFEELLINPALRQRQATELARKAGKIKIKESVKKEPKKTKKKSDRNKSNKNKRKNIRKYRERRIRHEYDNSL